MDDLYSIAYHEPVVDYPDDPLAIASGEHHCELNKCCPVLLYSELGWIGTFIIVRNLRRLTIAGPFGRDLYLWFRGCHRQCRN